MKKLLPVLVAALLVPGAALAKGPKNGTHTNQSSKANVMYVLKGVLCSYTAFTPANGGTAAVPGSIVMAVLHSNRHGKLLRSNSSACADSTNWVTVLVGAKTKIRLKHGVNSIAAGDRVAVKARAQRFAFKSATTTQQNIVGALASATAHMFRDWGPPKSG